MLPTILERLTASSEANCVDAAVVLSGYALGLLSHSMPREDVKAKLREEVRNFMTRELPGSKDANPDVTHPFPAHLSCALTEDESRHDGRGTRWAVSVLCSLVVLSGYDVFVHSVLQDRPGYVAATVAFKARNQSGSSGLRLEGSDQIFCTNPTR